MAAKDTGTPFSKTASFPDVVDLTYEKARDELLSIVASHESGPIRL